MIKFAENYIVIMFIHKVIKISFLILSYSVVLISCHQQASQTLIELQSKVHDNADSVTLILNSLQPDYGSMTEVDKALFDLCRVQIASENIVDFPSLEEIDCCISYFEKCNNSNYAAEGYYAKATYYKENRLFDKANECLLKALDLSEKAKDEPLSARIYFNLGHIAYMQDKYETGKSYLAKSLDLYQRNNDNKGKSNIYNVCSMTAVAQDNWEEAREYAFKALSLIPDSMTMGDLIENIGLSYYFQGNFDSAYYYLHHSFEYPAYSTNMSSRYYHLANFFASAGQYDSVQYYADKALELPMDIYIAEELYRVLTQMAVHEGNKEKASEYMRLRDQYKDSILIIEQKTDITYIDQIHQGTIVNQKHKSRQKYLTISIIGLLIVIVSLYVILQKKKRAKKEITESLKQHKEALKNVSVKSDEERVREINVYKAELNDYITTHINNWNSNHPFSEKEQIKRNAYIEFLNIKKEELFIANMNYLLVSFPDKLQQNFRKISYKEIVYCCLFVLDIPTTDIALIFNYTQSSQYKFKQRLIKKLQFSNAKDFESFLFGLFRFNT